MTPIANEIDELVDVRGHRYRDRIKGWRSWKAIDTIVLHQTGVWMNDTPQRFKRLRAHIGVLREHATPIVLVHDLRAYLWHANRLNRRSIGIEVNGLFLGRDSEELLRTRGIHDPQMDATRTAIAWVMDEVASHGGRIRRLVPHRVSNRKRRGDPGAFIWQTCGVWAQNELGLSDMGAGYVKGGLPIPHQWCPKKAYEGINY